MHGLQSDGAGIDATFGLSIGPGSTILVDMQWAQPWYGVATDLDMYLLTTGGSLLAYSESYNDGRHGDPAAVRDPRSDEQRGHPRWP